MISVKSLIEKLQTFPMDAIAVAEWDGGWSNLDNPKSQTDDKENPMVVFDCNEYGTYRRDRDD